MIINRMTSGRRRKGSVLLQTLVMCVVLSFIAVSLTQWILARYSSSSKLFNDSSSANGGYHGISNNFSRASVRAGAGNEDGYNTCYGSANADLEDSTGVSYASPSCSSVGSGVNQSNKYVFTVVIP